MSYCISSIVLSSSSVSVLGIKTSLSSSPSIRNMKRGRSFLEEVNFAYALSSIHGNSHSRSK